MKNEQALKYLTVAKVFLTALYTVGIFLIISMIRGFESDDWFWIGILLFYLIFLPVYISGMVILFLLRKKFKTPEKAEESTHSEPQEGKRHNRLRLVTILCGAVSILSSPSALLFSSLGMANAAKLSLLLSAIGTASALTLAVIDLIYGKVQAKRSHKS